MSDTINTKDVTIAIDRAVADTRAVSNTIKAEGNVVINTAEASRRERIATAALQGLLAGGIRGDYASSHEIEARMAVKYTDALIAELDKEKRG